MLSKSNHIATYDEVNAINGDPEVNYESNPDPGDDSRIEIRNDQAFTLAVAGSCPSLRRSMDMSTGEVLVCLSTIRSPPTFSFLSDTPTAQ